MSHTVTIVNNDLDEEIPIYSQMFDALDVNEIVQFLTRKKRKPRTTNKPKTEGGKP